MSIEATAERNAAGGGPSQRVIVFDVIETLLDVRALAPAFERAFGDPAVLQQWFSQMLQSAFAITVAGIYVDFGAVARAALQMTARRRGVVLTDEGVGRLLDGSGSSRSSDADHSDVAGPAQHPLRN